MNRNPSYIKERIIEKDNKYFTKEKAIIQFPKWYESKNLMEISGKEYFIYGIFAIIMNNSYSVSTIPTYISTTPILINETVIDGEEYYQFMYNKEDCIINNKSIVKKELLSYNLLENMIVRSKVPWFIEYEDLIKVLDNLKVYSGSKVLDNYLAGELLCSFIARNEKDPRIFYRQNTNSNIVYIDLLSPYSNLNTIAKLGGNYLTDNLVSALINKEKETSKLEELVRK